VFLAWATPDVFVFIREA
jgi:hypothetical protein